MVLQPLDLLSLRVEHLLHQEHLSLLLNQLPSVLSVLGSFNWNCETGSFSHVDFLLNLGVDCQSRRLDVCFAYLPQTTLSRWSVLLPDLQLSVVLSLLDLALLLFLFEREDLFIRGNSEGVVLLARVEHLSIPTILFISTHVGLRRRKSAHLSKGSFFI